MRKKAKRIMPKGIPNPKPVVKENEVDSNLIGLLGVKSLEEAVDAFVAEENTADEPGLFEVQPPQDEPFPDVPMIVNYTPTEIRSQDAFYLRQRAEQWRNEVALESIKAAANQLTMQAMTWAANQLDAMANEILLFPLSREVIPIEETDPD